MSAHIKRLMQLGYVQRDAMKGETDRRRINLSITRSGTQYLRSVSEKRADWLADRLAELGSEDRTALDRAAKSLKLILESVGEAV